MDTGCMGAGQKTITSQMAVEDARTACSAGSAPTELPVRRSRWGRLPQKTTLILVILLTATVSLLGSIIYLSARSMLQTSQVAQVNAFAYGIAATLGDFESTQKIIQIQFNALDKTPNLEFVVLTNNRGQQIAGLISDRDVWSDYWSRLDQKQGNSRMLGQVVSISRSEGRSSNAITVPVFQVDQRGQPQSLAGYLHASFSTEVMAGQLRFLQATVLLTCMGVILLAVPIAGLIARHITVPIQRLASAAHALASGDLSHRVAIARRDEVGELAEAFNRMADTMEQQQNDIRRINSGLEQKVHDRTQELEKLNKRLHAEIAEKEDFLRAVSHDLNAPLRNIAGMASMLAMKYQATLEQDALQRLERIQKNVQIETELINELLELSRIKTRREKIERVDLHELVTAIADGFSSDLETRGITLKIESHLPAMNCEKLRLRQVFQNLIDNAIKYMRTEGPKEIRIGCRLQEGEVVFSIADSGMGIAKEDVPHLFHVFRRAKNATVMKVPGKGVGLASVKSIVENYNGRIWVESVQGTGTTIFVAVPRSHFEEQAEVAV